ncbi:MAG: type II secretion system F family protein [bacterium]
MKFLYQSRTKDGQVQSGIVEASSKDGALNLLQGYGLYVTGLEESNLPIYSRKIEIFKGVSAKSLVLFTRQLAILIKANVPLVESLRTLALQTTKPTFREIIQDVGEKVEEGTPFSQAVAAHSKIFSPFFVGIVKAGEASGKLPESLEYLADHAEREYEFRAKIIGAMIYPAFVIIVFIAVIVLVLTFIIPQLTEVLAESGKELPALTKLVISLSSVFVNYWKIMILVVVAVVVLIVRTLKDPAGKKTIDRIVVGIPLIGGFIKKINVSQLAENLSTLISSGLPIVQALEITQDIVTNSVYKDAIISIGEGVKRGETISSTLFRYPDYFPAMFTQMVAVGERTGNLDTAMLNVVRFYQKEVSQSLDTMVGLLEPIMLIGLGAMVMGIMGSVLLPIYQIGMG